MKEEYRDIAGYENVYQISNVGNVKSLRTNKLLKPATCRNGYAYVVLSNNTIKKTSTVHQLVAVAFLNHIPNGHKLVVDHINLNKTDNRAENLRIISNRENSNRDNRIFSSKYIGVSWHKKANKWVASIEIDRKRIYLGLFETEIDAHNAYQNKLQSVV